MTIHPGIYSAKTEGGVHTSLYRLTLFENGSFEFMESDSHGGPNSSETFRGAWDRLKTGNVLIVKSVTSFSYSPVDDYPIECTATTSSEWQISPLDVSTVRLVRDSSVAGTGVIELSRVSQ